MEPATTRSNLQLTAAAIAAAAAAAAASGVVMLRLLRRRQLPKSFDLDRVLRPCVRQAKPYIFPPRYKYGESGPLVLLDANENPHGSPMDDNPAIQRLSLERYPDPNQPELKRALADLRGCATNQMMIGVGSDEVIDLLIRSTCTPGCDSILVCSPTYAMYGVFASINDVGTIDVPLTSDGEFQLRPGAIKAALTPRVKLMFLCSPGNPTSRLLKFSDIEDVLQAATNSIVVVDEAYIDFTGRESSLDMSCVKYVRSGRYPNLVVSQTLSKAWGLAGARIGIAFAQPALISSLDKIKAPFNLSAMAEDLAKQAIDKASLVRQRVCAILDERARLMDTLMQPPYFGPCAVQHVYRSDANFLLVRIFNCKAVCDKMAQESNVMVRHRGGNLHCEDCVRISVGTPSENDDFLRALRKAITC